MEKKQSFFLEGDSAGRNWFNEIQEIRPMEEKTRMNATDKVINVLENHILFLEEEMRNKNRFIEHLLKSLDGKSTNSTKSMLRDEAFFPSSQNLINKNEKSFPKNVAPQMQSPVRIENDNFVAPIDSNISLVSNSVNCELAQVDNDSQNNKNEFIELKTYKKANVTKRKNRKRSSETIVDNNNKRRVVAIMGDSMTKEIKGYEMSNDSEIIVSKSFSGATVNCMKDYIKPTLNKKPELLILHCGTNDIRKSNPDDLAENILELALECSKSTNVIVSSLVQRNDGLNDKIKETNQTLQKLCNDRNIGYIDNNNIDPQRHLNKSKLHLNRTGSRLLRENLTLAFKN